MKVASEYRERNFKYIRATCVTGGNEEDSIRGADSCGRETKLQSKDIFNEEIEKSKVGRRM